MKTKPSKPPLTSAPLATPHARSIALCILLALPLGYQSWQRCYVFQGQRELWTDTLEKNRGSLMAWCHAFQNNYEADDAIIPATIAAYRNAEAVSGLTAEEKGELGFVFMIAGRIEDAERYCEKAVMEARADQVAVLCSAHINLGLIALDRRQLSLAREHLGLAMKAVPRSPDAAYSMGLLEQLSGDPAGAEHWFRRAVTSKAASAKFADALGGALIQQGKYEEAAPWCQRAVELSPTTNAFRHNLAQALRGGI